MADDADIAYDFINRELADALNRRQRAAELAQGTKICVECGDDMPEVRQKLGLKLCKPCAEEAEKRNAQFA